MGGWYGMETAENYDCHASGYKARVPNIPRGTGAFEGVGEDGERASIHGDRYHTSIAIF